MKQIRACVTRFWTIKLAQVVCVVYILILTFSLPPVGLVDPSSGFIIDPNNATNTANGSILVNGDYRPVVAESPIEMFCLAMSRMSAFSLYPVIIAVFLSKCRATLNYLNGTPVAMFFMAHCDSSHELHAFAGTVIAFDVWVHVLFHLIRWGLQGNVHLLWRHATGVSGLVALVAIPLIAFPMMYCKERVPFELRKGLHYLFYLFAVGLCFHVPPTAFPNGGFIAPVLGFCVCLYALDALYVLVAMTEKIETTVFHVLPSGVQMTMPVSEAFGRRNHQGGYVFVCIPWVSKHQWHAFSLFENPANGNERQVFMLKTGDWTSQVHRSLQRNTVRPVWVQGPFPSPYSQAMDFDNQVLVATGIGITPALSVIRAHKDSRRCNLIWVVREAEMLEFFLERFELDHEGWNLVFYTGLEPLLGPLQQLGAMKNVHIIRGRPDLQNIIPNIIFGIESGNGLPEKCMLSHKDTVVELLAERLQQLDVQASSSRNNEPGSLMTMTATDKVVDLGGLAQSYGYLFTGLVATLDATASRSHPPRTGPAANDERVHSGTVMSQYGSSHIDDDPSARNPDEQEQQEQRSEVPSETSSHHRCGEMHIVHSRHGGHQGATGACLVEIVADVTSEKAAGTSNDAPPCSPAMITEGKDFSSPEAAAATEATTPVPAAGEEGQNDEEVAEAFLTRIRTYVQRRRLLEHPGDTTASLARAQQTMLMKTKTSIGRSQQGFLASAFGNDVRLPWEHIPGATEFVKGLDAGQVLGTWGILYCGGSKGVLESLSRIADEYRLRLAVESFSW